MHLLLIAVGVYAVVSVGLLVTFCLAAADRASRPAAIIYARQVELPALPRTAPPHERLDPGNAAVS